jgi:hypothetical protein
MANITGITMEHQDCDIARRQSVGSPNVKG